MNKKGFIRTLEAVVAVIVVFLFIFYASKNSDGDVRFVEGIRSLQESILDDISKNDDFRKCIVEYDPLDQKGIVGRDDISDGSAYEDSESPCFGTEKIGDFIEENLPSRFKGQGKNSEFVVCNVGECRLPDISAGEVYTSAVIITSSVDNGEYKPRILRIWLF